LRIHRKVVAIWTLFLFFSSCWGVLSNALGLQKIGILFSTSNKGQAPSACEQVNIAAKADCGLKLSSYVLENPN
jgi:hypothetical protein